MADSRMYIICKICSERFKIALHKLGNPLSWDIPYYELHKELEVFLELHHHDLKYSHKGSQNFELVFD